MPNSKNLPFGFAMNINTQNESSCEVLQEQRDDCFSIAMMGDFSGGAELANIADRRFIAIDRYNFDEVFGSMALQLSLSLDGTQDNNVNLALKSLKDFQPDRLYKNVEVFQQLRDLRDRLNNPATFKQAMQEMDLPEKADRQPEPEVQQNPPQQATDTALPSESGASLLDSIMDETADRLGQDREEGFSPAGSDVKSKTKSLVDIFVQQAVAGRKTISRDARQDELVASVDEVIARQMCNLLHHPQFQALESLWRAVFFIVKRVRSGKAVKLYLLDVSAGDLATDLAADDVTQTQLYQQFCDSSAGDIRWNLIIGDYRFGASIDDMLVLSQIGMIAQQAAAHFIAAADESLVGCGSFSESSKASDWQNEIDPAVEEAWSLLRQSPVAKAISLALPRFLLRIPYGRKTSPVTAFNFEEMPEQPEHEAYLWGNPAFVKAEQIARAFLDSGWEMKFANVMKVEDLPIHIFGQAGQTLAKPCAEIALTDSGASKMIAQGLIPLWSVKNTDRIHSGDFHSIAE
jgi:type VI secretion system protein ImpC